MDSIFMALAVSAAKRYVGATAPNPPVGACLVKDGRVLAVGAHERAGLDHAELAALREAVTAHGTGELRGATLYVTLEPCNHQGKTPPCTRAILEAGIARVVYGASDHNPKVAGGGAVALREAGICVEAAEGREGCFELVRPFQKWCRTGRPWVIHKIALNLGADSRLTMVPPPGRKTFTSQESLAAAHRERKECDAIITGIGTVLADRPLFTVRHVQDHPDRRRKLAVLSRSGRRAPLDWVERQTSLGFDVVSYASLEEALDGLGSAGALRALVEAGPALSDSLRASQLWDERLTFVHLGSDSDVVYREQACSRES